MLRRRNSLYILIILALLVGLFTGRALFFNLAILFGTLMLLSFLWAWSSVRGLGIGRKTRTRRAQVGQVFREQFSAKNKSIIPKLWLEIRDHSTLPNHKASRVITTIGSRRSKSWDVETICTVRGEFQLGPIDVISGDPFGLYLTPRHILQTEKVIVYPETFPIDQIHLTTAMLTGGEAQRQISHNITTNAVGVRDYVPGDSLNRMHWKSTARRGKLMVKEFEIDPMVNIWLFPDFSSLSVYEDLAYRAARDKLTYQPNGFLPPSTEEYTASITASIAKHFLEKERTVGFTAYIPHREEHEPERGTQQLNRILELLAIAKSKSEYRLADMLALEQSNLRRGTTLILVTSSLDPAWLHEAQILVQRGLRMLCVLIDPGSFGGAYPSEDMQVSLQLAKIPFIVVQQRDNLTTVLSEHPII